ncbi:MAG: peroxide stress protein YaaA [Gammaproteobacteria bacterium]
MLVVISPAKTLDFETPLTIRKHTLPEHLEATGELVGIMQRKKPADLKQLMGISDKLAELNVARYRDWQADPAANARQAVLAFMGDVYTGLDARSLPARDLDFAQKHLRILSGLYGVLRPLDLIKPYRLEMGTALATRRGANLYRFWGDAPTASLNLQARALRTRWLVNLASNEYFGVIATERLEPAVITPIFEDWSRDRYKVISFHAKKARGMMARFIIETRARKPLDLHAFDRAGYRYVAAASSEDRPVFRRRQD